MPPSLGVLCTVTLLVASPRADWPCFLGPQHDGTSEETGLLREFPESGPEVLWTVEIGPGYGGVAVRDGEVYLHDRVTGEADLLRVFDLESGEEVWGYEYEAPGRLQFQGSRCVPTVGEELLYLQGGQGKVLCMDRVLHDLVWSVDLVSDYEAEDPGYGWCQAPLVFDDLVVVAPMSEQAMLVALDRDSGEEVWRTEDMGFSHSTPMRFELCGEPQIVFVSALVDPTMVETNAFGLPDDSSRGSGLPPTRTYLSSFVPETGELLWRSEAYHSSYPIPAPVKVDGNHLFLTGGYQAGSSLVEVTRDEEDWNVEALFHYPRGSQIHVPFRVGEHFYLLANENQNDNRTRQHEGGLACIDSDGNEVWRTGNDPYFGRGGMILADGMLIIQDGYNGTLRLVEPTPEGYRPLAEANVFGIADRKDHQMWAPLALADGRLLMRSQEELKCVDLRGSGS
jgi:outer membrane protein assembly factor BamB